MKNMKTFMNILMRYLLENLNCRRKLALGILLIILIGIITNLRIKLWVSSNARDLYIEAKPNDTVSEEEHNHVYDFTEEMMARIEKRFKVNIN